MERTMASNAELTAENKTLKTQVEELQKQLEADKVSKSSYDALKAELDALKEQQKANAFPTLKSDVEALQRTLNTVTNERDQARADVIEAANKIRSLESKQRVEAPEEPEEELNIPKDQLLILAALCLPFARTESGRPMTETDLRANGPGFSKAAIELAKGIVRQLA